MALLTHHGTRLGFLQQFQNPYFRLQHHKMVNILEIYPVDAQVESYQENRRRTYVDEDASEYIYDDYELPNSLDRDTVPSSVPLSSLDPPRDRRPPVLPKRNPSPYNFKNDLRRPQSGGLGPTGADGCRSGVKTAAHESQCDLYYECYGDQGFIQQCPNGLMYNGGGAFGLLGPCDYPHNVNCYEREGRSKLAGPGVGLLVCMTSVGVR